MEIYTCFPPTNLTVSNSTLTTTTAYLSWTPSAISANHQWDLEWGTAGFSLGSGNSVFVNSTPAYEIPNLHRERNMMFIYGPYCSASDKSAWVKKTFRTHYFTCPTGAVAEGEACGSSINNGCEQVPAAYGTITNGETICGTSWLHRTHRDSDWYSFTLTGTNDVTISGNAEFSSFFGIAPSPCFSSLFDTSYTNGAGSNTPIIIRLGAGTYYLCVASSFAEQVVCDSLSRYWVKLTCNPCLSPTALDATNFATTSADLTWTSTVGLWNIEWGSFRVYQGSGNIITGTISNPYHLTGLIMGNSYSYYVQSACGGSAISNWAGPYTFFPALSGGFFTLYRRFHFPVNRDHTTMLAGEKLPSSFKLES